MGSGNTGCERVGEWGCLREVVKMVKSFFDIIVDVNRVIDEEVDIVLRVFILLELVFEVGVIIILSIEEDIEACDLVFVMLIFSCRIGVCDEVVGRSS